jgi:phosphatidylglycerol lysyltransferase
MSPNGSSRARARDLGDAGIAGSAVSSPPGHTKPHLRRPNLLNLLGVITGLAVFVVAATAMREALHHYRYADLVAAFHAMPGWRIGLSVLLAAASYAALTGYDLIALRYLGRPLAYRRSALASFASYAIGNNAGFGNFASSSIRYRLYSGWGLGAMEIAKLVALCTLTFWSGFLAVTAVALTLDPFHLPPHFTLGIGLRPIGVLAGMTLAGYAVWSARRSQPLNVRGIELEPPHGQLFAAQVAVSAIDWTLAATALYVLLPSTVQLSWLQFLGLYVLTGMLALLSHIPGGLGVLESLLVALLASSTVPASTILASALVYRVVYYLLPLLAASIMLGGYEGRRHAKVIVKASRFAFAGLSMLAPPLLAFTTFLGGAILILSGSTPPVAGRMAVLEDFLPLSVIEASHFFASVIGVCLIILSRGLSRRLDGAMRLSAVLLATGAVLSLLKGGDWEEALALTIMLGVLLASRGEFRRKSAFLNEPFGAGWTFAALVVVIGAAWLGLFALKHVEYSHELWWRFAADEHAPRFLRASIGIATVAVAFSLYRLIRPLEIEPTPPTEEDMACVREIVARSPHASANLALLGDKTFLFNEARTAFLMYGVCGRTWIAMGDPVGPEEEWGDLVWSFQRACDTYAARPAFYEVSADRLDLYADLGLTFFRMGEEASVPLDTFSLQGGGRKTIRHAIRQIEHSGCSFRIASAEEVATLLPELRAISNEWLATKKAREKRFSLGRFDEAYVSRFPCALVEKDGVPVAFANLWATEGKEEASIDLMRFSSMAPHGVMDFLFVHLLLWAQKEGYRRFSLGMSPLSGLDRRRDASLWNRIGTFIYRHGEHFYNFEGLRRYKNKFDPVWQPVYLACPGVWSLPQVLTDLSSLVSGGVQGVFRK